jgi:hypothetical protein
MKYNFLKDPLASVPQDHWCLLNQPDCIGV